MQNHSSQSHRYQFLTSNNNFSSISYVFSSYFSIHSHTYNNYNIFVLFMFFVFVIWKHNYLNLIIYLRLNFIKNNIGDWLDLLPVISSLRISLHFLCLWWQSFKVGIIGWLKLGMMASVNWKNIYGRTTGVSLPWCQSDMETSLHTTTNKQYA